MAELGKSDNKLEKEISQTPHIKLLVKYFLFFLFRVFKEWQYM